MQLWQARRQGLGALGGAPQMTQRAPLHMITSELTIENEKHSL